MLWVPTLFYVALMLGTIDRGPEGELVYRVSTRGLVSTVLLTVAALLITYGERRAFAAGIVFWLLALAALLLNNSVLMVIHF
jgi:hypothetical protein